MNQNSVSASNSIEKILEETGVVVTSPVGTSMWPMLRHRFDHIVITPVKGNLKRLDIPLYRRSNGQLVLHRIIKVRKQDYVICGDNMWKQEYGITNKEIIGVLSGFYRGKHFIRCQSPLFRLYSHLWCSCIYLRIPFILIHRVWLKVKRY